MLAATVALTALIVSSIDYQRYVYFGAQIDMNNGISASTGNDLIHTTYTFRKGGKVVYAAYHAGAITKLGMNLTLCKLTGVGTSGYNLTTYNLNTTWVAIGYNATDLVNTLTALPNEWNCTAGTLHDLAYNKFNVTAVFHPSNPGGSGFTAQCIGLKYEQGGATTSNATLWGYDNFPTAVTGIDNTFTITIEIQVTVS